MAAFAILWLVIAGPALGQTQNQVKLSSHPQSYQAVVSQASLLRDPTLRLSPEQVAKMAEEFRPVQSRYTDFGLTRDRMWLRFAITNPTQRSGEWRLNVHRQYFEELQVYVLRSDLPPQLMLAHDQTEPFSAREIPNRFLLTDLQMAAGESAEILIGYRSTSTTNIPLGIGRHDGVAMLHAREQTVDHLLNGSLLAMIIVALLLTPIIGHKLSIAFALYLTAGMVFVGNADGYTFRVLWPDQPWINEPMNLAAMLLMPATGLNFARQLFRFKETSPLTDRILFTACCILAAAAIASFFLIKQSWFMIPAYAIIPVATLLPIFAGTIAYRSDRVGAVPYLIGAVLVCSSFAYALIAHLIPGEYNLDWTLDYGHFTLLCEGIAFAAAIMLRMLYLRNQRDDALTAQLAASTEQLRLNEELLESRRVYDEAKQLSEERRDKLYEVSHDIRQPLMALRSAMGQIRGSHGKVGQQIHSAFEYLENLTLANLPEANAKDRAGEEDGSTEVLPVRTVLDNVKELFADQAAAKGLEFRYRPNDLSIRADPVALMRVINNLVSNAVRYTDEGSILLAARRRKGRVRIEVWDTGTGMDDQERAAMMAKFAKGDGSTGSGLGLAIVSEICAEHGFEFEFRSRKLRGSVASVSVAMGHAE